MQVGYCSPFHSTSVERLRGVTCPGLGIQEHMWTPNKGFPHGPMHLLNSTERGPRPGLAHTTTREELVALIWKGVSLGRSWKQPSLQATRGWPTSTYLVGWERLLGVCVFTGKPNSHRAEQQVCSSMSTTGQWMSLLRHRKSSSPRGNLNRRTLTIWWL